MISLFNFITTLPKTNIYPKNWLVWHVFIWWRNKKTISLFFLLAGHDEEQNFMSKMGIILTRSGICQCLWVGILWFLALVREAEQEWGSTWRTLWLILDKVPKKELCEGAPGAALGFALQEMQQLTAKLSLFSCCPTQGLHLQPPKQSFAWQSQAHTPLLSLLRSAVPCHFSCSPFKSMKNPFFSCQSQSA